MSECRYFGPIRARRQGLQADVNTDYSTTGRESIRDLALDADVPTPPRVLNKSSDFRRSLQVSALPKSVVAAAICYPITGDAMASLCLEDYPAEGAARAEAAPELRAPSARISGIYKPTTNLADAVCKDAKLL